MTDFLRWILIPVVMQINVLAGFGQPDLQLETARDGKVFKVFQFPQDGMPRIDGMIDDWEIVPDSYIYRTKELNDTEDGHGVVIDTEDLQVAVRVGWVKGLNRIYFLYEAYDNYWDFGRFNPEGYLNDIFEIVVDGDLSGGPFIFNPIYDSEQLKWNGKNQEYLNNHFEFSGVHAQNYHIFTPPVNNAWCLVWGSQPWIAEFPYANHAYKFDFNPGESGHLVLEGWITPFDYAPYEGPQEAVVSQMKENDFIGLSWSILDFDGSGRDGHFNLSHNVNMVKNASYLCAFKLMPIENEGDLFRADWTYQIIDMKEGWVAFKDGSLGAITKWTWDFGDGSISHEQNPVHRFAEKGVHKVITLTVEGPGGTSKRTRYWEVMIR